MKCTLLLPIIMVAKAVHGGANIDVDVSLLRFESSFTLFKIDVSIF